MFGIMVLVKLLLSYVDCCLEYQYYITVLHLKCSKIGIKSVFGHIILLCRMKMKEKQVTDRNYVFYRFRVYYRITIVLIVDTKEYGLYYHQLIK